MEDTTTPVDAANGVGYVAIDLEFYRSLLNQTIQAVDKEKNELTTSYNAEIANLNEKKSKAVNQLSLLDSGFVAPSSAPPASDKQKMGVNGQDNSNQESKTLASRIKTFVEQSPFPVTVQEVVDNFDHLEKTVRDTLSRLKGVERRETLNERNTMRPLYHRLDSPESAFQERADQLGWKLKKLPETA